jgi:hypothetical protein
MVASVMFVPKFNRGIEQNGVTSQEECLRTNNPGNALVEKVIFVLDATRISSSEYR